MTTDGDSPVINGEVELPPLRVEVKPSPVHGRGVFTTEDVSKGSKLCMYDGEDMSKSEHKARGEDLSYVMSHPGNPSIVRVGFQQEKDPFGVGQFINDFACLNIADRLDIKPTTFRDCENYVRVYQERSYNGANVSFQLAEGHFWLYATKDIRRGDELFLKYGADYWLYQMYHRTTHLLWKIIYSQLMPTPPIPDVFLTTWDEAKCKSYALEFLNHSLENTPYNLNNFTSYKTKLLKLLNLSGVLTDVQYHIHSSLQEFYQLHSSEPVGDDNNPEEKRRLVHQRGLHYGTNATWRNLHATKRLYLAAVTDDTKEAEAALRDGAAVDAVGSKDGISPLHVAAEHDAVEVCKLLLDKGATSDPLDNNGHTPLLRALQFEAERVKDLLLDRMCDSLGSVGQQLIPTLEPQDETSLECLQQKELGNEAYKKKNYRVAIDRYTGAISLCALESSVAVILLANRAQCHLALSQHNAALQDVDAALRQDPHHLKCLYRRAVAIEGLRPDDLGAISEPIDLLLFMTGCTHKEARAYKTKLVSKQCKLTYK